MRSIAFLCSLLSVINLPAQIIQSPPGKNYTGLCAYSLQQADAFSFVSNQACLTRLKSISAGVFTERKFWLKELSHYTAVIALPASTGNFGLKMAYSGFSGYNESQIGFAYAHDLGSRASTGIQFNYNNIHIGNYGNAAALSFEAGMQLRITDKLCTGFHVNNPAGGKFKKGGFGKLPSVYSVGLGYDASEKFYFTASIIKEEDKEATINAGIHYQFIPQVMARAGVSFSLSSFWFALGVSLSSFRLDVVSTYHPQLGISPGLLLLFHFNNKEQLTE